MAYDPKGQQWWQDALGGKEPPIHADQPMYGFYAYRKRKEDPYVPVALWYKDGDLKCKIGETAVRYGIDIWPNVARNPITYDVYKSVMAGDPWPNEIRFTDATGKVHSTQGGGSPSIGDNSGKTNPILDDIVEWTTRAAAAKKKGVPETKDDADALADISTKLLEMCSEAEKERLELTRPLLDKQREIKASFDKITVPGKTIATDLKALINSFLSKERERQKEAAAKLQAAADENGIDAKVQIAAPKVGTRGKSVSQVAVSFVILDDIKAAAAYFAAMKEPPKDFVEAIERNSYRILHAGAEVPGARIEKKTQAR